MSKEIVVEQIKSGKGCTKVQIACLKGLGLGRIGSSRTLKNVSEIRGMVKKVLHLVKFTELRG